MDQQKLAANFQDAVKTMGGHAAGALQQGLGHAVAGAGVAAVGIAASKLYEAATKSRDFRMMLAHNPDLHEAQQVNPVHFNQMFTSLRGMVPEFSKDPLVAGEYMRRMASDPQHAGGYLVSAMQDRPKLQPQHMQESFQRAGLEGIKPHSAQSLPYGAPPGGAMQRGPDGGYSPRRAKNPPPDEM